VSLRIAYIGPAWGTSLHRARALERLGHTVSIIDPWSWLGKSKWVGRWQHHTGAFGVCIIIKQRIIREVYAARPDMIWVNQGELLSASLMQNLHSINVPIVNYANDNPFCSVNKYRFRKYKTALPFYDLIVVTFEDNVTQAMSVGAKKVMRVFMCADEKIHSQCELTTNDHTQFDNDVSYISQWAPERGAFLAKLVGMGIPISIWGDRWNKAKEWPILTPYWRGPGIYDRDYSKIIQCSKISLCLLYKAAGNLHTNRSIEIPALGTLLCAERSVEHQTLYDEGKEAIFFNNADECADLCHKYLADNELRMDIARRGHERALRNNLFNEPVMASIIEAAMNVR